MVSRIGTRIGAWMIRELFESWTTPATPEARKLGYLYESIAYRARFRRCEKSWKGHLENCHRAILSACESLARTETLLIMGSGPLYEIPMEELKERFSRVILVDLVQPLEVRRRWGQRADVLLMEQDLLGLCGALTRWKAGQALPIPNPPDLSFLSPDFILSANCLSQLPLVPRERLSRIARGALGDDVLNEFCNGISRSHLEHVRSFGKPNLVISDYETRLLDRRGLVTQRSSPFFETEWMTKVRDWNWSIAPRGEIDISNSLEMSVGAFEVR